MTRPQDRSNPTPARAPGRRRSWRVARMTLGGSLLLAAAAGVALGAAAYSRNAAANSAAISTVSADQAPLSPSAQQRLVTSDEEDRGRGDTTAPGVVADTGGREVIPGLQIKIGRIRLATDPSGVKATTLPLSVTNTGALTRSFDITVVALSDQGKIITSDVGTATNLRPGQSAEVQVLEIVDDSLTQELTAASFRIEDAFAY